MLACSRDMSRRRRGRHRREEEVLLAGASAADAVRTSPHGKADLVLGGTFADLPLAAPVKLPRECAALRSGVGTVRAGPDRARRPARRARRSARLLRAGDRPRRVDRRARRSRPWRRARPCSSRGWTALPEPVAPAWLGDSARRSPGRRFAPTADRLFGKRRSQRSESPCPTGPAPTAAAPAATRTGERSASRSSARASASAADFELIDEVAPSSSPAWFVRRFRCGAAPVCDAEADELLDAARADARPCPALRPARPGRRAGSTSAAVHPDRRAGPLVAGFEPHPGLRREPFRRVTRSPTCSSRQARQTRWPIRATSVCPSRVRHRPAVGPPAGRSDGEACSSGCSSSPAPTSRSGST